MIWHIYTTVYGNTQSLSGTSLKETEGVTIYSNACFEHCLDW